MTIKFPLDPSILWDRSPISGDSIVCRSTEICSFLVLLSNDVEKLLETFVLEEGNTVDFIANLHHLKELSEDYEQVILSSSYYNTCKFPFVLQASSTNVLNQITIPMKAISFPDTFQNHSTAEHRSQLQQQLEKALKQSKSLALKNFLRLRAYGKASRTLLNPHHSSISGSLKIESTIPDFSMQCIQIKSIPVLPTALSSLLFTSSHDIRKNSDFPSFGYLTLDQTRKIVFLKERDPSTTTVPTIGVWLRIDVDQVPDFSEIAGDIIYHPLCWAACLRFIQNEHLLKQYVLEQNTFLLMILCNGYCQYFEITPLVSDMTGSLCPIRSLSDFHLSFLELDFTVNLNIEQTQSSAATLSNNCIDLNNSVVCKFKMLPKYYRSPAPISRQIGETNDYLRVGDFIQFTSPRSQSQSQSIRQSHEWKKERTEESTLGTVNPPIPREIQYLPQPVGSPSRPHPLTASQSMREQASIQSANSAASSIAPQPPLINVVISQSQEITRLKNYIHALRKIITDLGGEYPDLYIEEVATESQSNENASLLSLDPTSHAEEISINNVLDRVDNNNSSLLSNLGARVESEQDKERDDIPTTEAEIATAATNNDQHERDSEPLIKEYLSTDEILEIRNFADIDSEDYEEDDFDGSSSQRQDEDMKASPAMSLFPAAKILRISSKPDFVDHHSPSWKSSDYSPVKIDSLGSATPIRHKTGDTSTAARTAVNQNVKPTAMEAPSQVNETQSILRILSNY